MPAALALPEPSAASEGFERLTRMLRASLAAPEVRIAMLGGEPSDHPLCRRVVDSASPVVIEDGGCDGVAGYAGVPLRDPRGEVVGTVCASDPRPRAWTARDLEVLGGVAAMATTEIGLRLATEEVARTAAQSAALVESALDAIVVMDADGSVVDFNPAAVPLFGYSREEAIGTGLGELIVPPEHRAQHTASVRRQVATGISRILDRRIEVDAQCADGTEIPVELTVHRTDVGAKIRFTGFVRDLSGVRAAERALSDARTHMAAIVDSAPFIVFALDPGGHITFSEGSGLAALGLEPGETVGRHVSEFNENADDVRRALEGQKVTSVTRIAGIVFETHFRPIRGDAGALEGIVGVGLDVTERLRDQDRVEQLAYFDPVTGLPNRLRLEAEVEQALRAAGADWSGALLCLDLDDFKTVNDSLGHETGDAVLVEVGRRLAGAVDLGAGQILARSTGDSFLLFLGGRGTTAWAEAAADRAARRIRGAFGAPFEAEGVEFELSATTGVSLLHSGDEGAFGESLRRAEAAMYRAKRSLPGGHAFYERGAHDPRERLTMTARRRRALAREEFTLHYQPIYSLPDRRPTALEALIRWQDPELGLVAPAAFVPAAESSGLIVEIGARVVDAACRQLAEWSRLGHRVSVGFNVSPVQLRRDDFVDVLLDTIERHGVAPGSLVAEITESVAMEDVAQTQSVLQALAAGGIGLVIDDFGAGHSSLTRLATSPSAR